MPTADGGFVVTWHSTSAPGTDGDVGGGSGYAIMAQRFDVNANPLGGEQSFDILPEVQFSSGSNEFRVNWRPNGSQQFPKLAVLNDGSFVIAYQSFFGDFFNGVDETAAPGGSLSTADTNSFGILFNRYDADGNIVTRSDDVFDVNQTRVNQDPTGDQIDVDVVALLTGGFAVTWVSDTDQSGVGDAVKMRIYDQNGFATTPEFQVNTTNFDGDRNTSATTLADGTVMVTWAADIDPGAGVLNEDCEIYGQKVGTDGSLIGNEIVINTNQANNQLQPDIAALTNGGFAVVWETTTDVQGGDAIIKIGGRVFGPNAVGLRELTAGSGSDVVFGTEQADDIDTLGGNDVINALGGDDVIRGGTGADGMTGGSGADRFVWNVTAEGQFLGQLIDNITDFQAGAGGDTLDFSSFIALGGGNIANFVQLAEASGSTTVSVDFTGTLTNLTPMVLLQDVTGLVLNDLVNDGNLLVGA